MASGGSKADVKSTFAEYKERTETTDSLKLTPFLKCVEACGLKTYKSTIETSIWGLHQDKQKKCSYDTIYDKVIVDLAADVVGRKKGVKGRADHSDPDVVKLAEDIRGKFAAKAGQAAHKATKTNAVTDRLTDASGYTGSHKERFDKDGKGKGIEGRADIADNSGYVGNYKGAGTYDKK